MSKVAKNTSKISKNKKTPKIGGTNGFKLDSKSVPYTFLDYRSLVAIHSGMKENFVCPSISLKKFVTNDLVKVSTETSTVQWKETKTSILYRKMQKQKYTMTDNGKKLLSKLDNLILEVK